MSDAQALAEALLPCPFCGGAARYEMAYGVRCLACGTSAPCTGHDFGPWNRRAANDAAPAPDGLTGIWPDFIAPSKYEAPDPRWQDPGLPDFRLIWKLAREKGYAVGLHGSMKRDCDLIAAPWVEDAAPVADLIAHLRQGLNADEIEVKNADPKPHGRQAFVLQIRDAYKKAIDISVMAPAPDGFEAGMRRAAEWHDAQIAELEHRISENNAYTERWGRRSDGANIYCRELQRHHRLSRDTILAAIPAAGAWEPPADRRDGFECLAKCTSPDGFRYWQTVYWQAPTNDEPEGLWTDSWGIEIFPDPTAFAPAPAGEARHD